MVHVWCQEAHELLPGCDVVVAEQYVRARLHGAAAMFTEDGYTRPRWSRMATGCRAAWRVVM